MRRLRPVQVGFQASRGVRLLSAQGHVEVGHLAKATGSRALEWFVATDRKTGQLCQIKVMGGTGGNQTVKVRLPDDG